MSRNYKILVVDDESSIREFLEIMLKRENYDVFTIDSAVEALKLLHKEKFDIVITDISMPHMSGIDLLNKIKQTNHSCAVIIMTAYGSMENAISAMRLGAVDYLNKPFQIEDIKSAIKSAIKLLESNHYTATVAESNNDNTKSSTDSIIGKSEKIASVIKLINRVSETKANILLLGESGTGKEVIAHAIHQKSATKEKKFVAVNCAAIPESLFESELFGYKKGAFTGAMQDKVGIFEQADGGTLFLDEVGDIPLSVQVKLLRAIQQKVFRAIGGTEDIQVNVRIICATNKNLEEMVKNGTFREDLFYRLNVIQVKLPTLRERKEDIPLLIEHFLHTFSLASGKQIKGVNKDAMGFLKKYDYPGNIRELENIIERAIALESSENISIESLPQKVLLWHEQDQQTDSSPNQENVPMGTTKQADISQGFNLERNMEEFEKQYITKALEQANGIKKKAAELLGITFRSLRYRIEKYGIDDPNPEEKE